MASMVGRTLGGFRVEREIGRGGMGIVLLATQESLGRPAVLKRILAELAAHAELAERFDREARTAASLHHQNVVAVYDRFTHRGAHYIAQEYVDGSDLAKLLELEGRLPVRIASLIALEMLRGLEAIHAQGTLHRDLKPHNLLIGRRGEVKIADFGLALDTRGTALTRPGIALGTPPYMAPEQMRGERVDPRCDVFAAGCVLYEMVAGIAPFLDPRPAQPPQPSGGADDAAAAKAPYSDEHIADSLVENIQQGRFLPLRKQRRDVPRRLARMVARCLRARPARRPGSAQALRQELESFLDHPSAADAQAEIAGFLWERQLFEERESDTLVLVAGAPKAERRKRPRWVPLAAAAALAASLFCVGLALDDPQAVMRTTDRVQESVTRLALR